MKIVWTEDFRDELRHQYEFIRKQNPQAARDVRDRITSAVRRLRDFPRSGRTWRIPGAFELVIPATRYTVIYDIQGDTVVVLSLFHTSRRESELH